MPKAFAFIANGGPEVEALLDIPLATPGSGQMLVAVRAAGVNPVDWKRRSGLVPTAEFPAVFGGEVSGVVETLGDGVTAFEVGDEVFGNAIGGGYAEYTLLSDQLAARKPAAVPFSNAATLSVAAAAAYDGVRQLDLPAGRTLLIVGVGGGVGVAAAQIAMQLGINVIGTASGSKKEFVESLGVTHVVYGPGVADRVRAAAPNGVDAIYDLIGGEAVSDVAPLLSDTSKLITAAGDDTAVKLGGSPVARARNRAVLEALAALAADGALDPHVTATYSLTQAGDALHLVEGGHAVGKTVIEIA